MISKTMQEAIGAQIQKEFYSAYLYLSMSNYFEGKNLGGFAKWLRVQFAEEQEHALKFLDFVHARGGAVHLGAIQQPPSEWKTNLAAFENVLEHEQAVTASIYKLYETALAEKDYPAQILLQWFINEQVEEEKNATDIVAQLKLIDAHGTAVLMLDHQLGKRGAD
jgi:ferritin